MQATFEDYGLDDNADLALDRFASTERRQRGPKFHDEQIRLGLGELGLAKN